MPDFKHKTYNDSYLYGKEMNKNNLKLSEYIINAERIDKHAPSFAGIIDYVKRQQTSSILYTVLMMDDVILCNYKVEMPRAFKVFDAYDIKMNRNKKVVFIDITKLIEMKDGYYECKKIDVFITYLFSALGYLLYNKSPMKLVNNSNISISGTECFVSLFDYIIDYLRIIGFAQNKEKISYLAGLYFLHHMMSKDIDSYTKNIAAKCAGLSNTEIRGFDLYYDIKDLDNIDTFVSMIAETFKLKGLTTEVFVNKWMYLYGTGTYYATELFPAFSKLVTDAYCGSYVVNQKQVERCCGTSMVNYSTALLKLGVEEFDNKAFMMSESEYYSIYEKRDPNTIALREALFNKKKKLPDELKLGDKDYANASSAISKIKKIEKFYNDNNQEKKISQAIKGVIYVSLTNFAIYVANKSQRETCVYKKGVPVAICKVGSPMLNDKDRDYLLKQVKSCEGVWEKKIEELRDTDKEYAKEYSTALVELRQCIKHLESPSRSTHESYDFEDEEPIQEGLIKKAKNWIIPKEYRITEEDYSSKSTIINKFKGAIKHYKDTDQDKTLSTYVRTRLFDVYSYTLAVIFPPYDDICPLGIALAMTKEGAKYLNEKDKIKLRNQVSDGIREIHNDAYKRADALHNNRKKEMYKTIDNIVKELEECIKYLQ